MALIDCQGCKQKISDKARVCPKCGYTQEQNDAKKNEEKQICEECGAAIAIGLDSCPNCGNPTVFKLDYPQKVEVTRIRLPQIKKKTKSIIGIALVALMVVILGTIVVVSQINKRNAEKYAEEYAQNLDLITYGMLSGAADAETVSNLTRSVWYNSIYQESDATTDKYTKNKRGNFYDDFNTSLGSLFSDSDFTKLVDAVKDNQTEINHLMKQLANPPEDLKDAYFVLKDYYDAYYELTTLAISPTGSLQTYTDNLNQADSDVLKYYNSMKLYLD